MQDLIFNRINESIETKKKLLKDSKIHLQIEDISKKILESLQSGGKVIFAGNGGSFADSQHLSAEFVSRFLFDRPALASVALGTNNSNLTAIGNDYGYEDVFSRELEAIGNINDIFIGISTSGSSPNIISAFKASKKIGMHSIALTGSKNCPIWDMVESIKIPSTDTARIQECHITVGHIICEIVEAKSFAAQ
jgi:D-sedoheptulose 7-phosphate isomerase